MSDWEFDYNAVTFGAGLNGVDVVEIEGLDLPGLRTSDLARPQAHGMFAGNDWLTGRTITMTLELAGMDDDTRAAVLNDLAAAFAPQTVELPLTFQLPGQDAREIHCRPRRVASRVDLSWVLGVTRLLVEWFASDPRIYGTDLHSLSTGLGSTTGGLGLPHGFPHGFGTVSAGIVTATNAGNFATFPTFTITANTGGLINPRITNQDTDESVIVDIELLAGDVLTIDAGERTVFLNGTATRTGLVRRPDSEWFELPPGSTGIRFSASSGDGTLGVAWRDAWIW